MCDIGNKFWGISFLGSFLDFDRYSPCFYSISIVLPKTYIRRSVQMVEGICLIYESRISVDGLMLLDDEHSYDDYKGVVKVKVNKYGARLLEANPFIAHEFQNTRKNVPAMDIWQYPLL